MWIPTVKVRCKLMIAGALGLMTIGSITEHAWIRGWGAMLAVFGVGVCLHASIRRWAYQPFQDGYTAGFEAGREAGVAEGFALAAGERARK